MKMKICQSCGIPIESCGYGTNADGSLSEDYCVHCLKDGAFTADVTMEEMVEFCAQFVEVYNINYNKLLSREAFKYVLRASFPKLKRWKVSKDQLPQVSNTILKQLLSEINELGIQNLPVIKYMGLVEGAQINRECELNGNLVRLLDDNAVYYYTEIEKNHCGGRFFGVIGDNLYIYITEYGGDGQKAEVVAVKRRI